MDRQKELYKWLSEVYRGRLEKLEVLLRVTFPEQSDMFLLCGKYTAAEQISGICRAMENTLDSNLFFNEIKNSGHFTGPDMIYYKPHLTVWQSLKEAYQA